MEMMRAIYGQLRVMRALALRETRTRFGDQRIGYLWALLEPAIWILTFYIMFAIAGRGAPPGMDLFTLLATGVVPYDIFAKSADRAAAAISANKALLFYPQVRPLDLIFARSALEFATYLTVFSLFMGVHVVVTGAPGPQDILMVFHGLVLASAIGTTFGLMFCALGVYSTMIERVRGHIMRPLFWISGLFFTANSMPTPALRVVEYNPVLHAVELVRGGWFATYTPRYVDAAYAWSWVIGFAFVGLTIERAARSRVQVT